MAKRQSRRIGPGVKYSALKLSQNDQLFYYATIPIEDIFPYCMVSTREKDPEGGFQRSLSRDRAEDIAEYLNSGTGSIPTNIVLSAQPIATLSFHNKQISFERTEGAFLVLDGQHRLWGYQICMEKHSKNHRVPVAIYTGLSRADEARLFIDINTNQRGVPATLLLDIKQVAQIETGLEPRLRSLFDFLNKNDASPLIGRLSPTKASKGKINRVTFNRALTDSMRSIGVGLDDEKFKQLVLNYLKALEQSLSGFPLIFKATIFEAVFAVMDDVVRIAITNSGNAKVKSLGMIIKSMNAVDLKASGYGRKDLTDALRAAVKSNININAAEL